MYGLRKTGCDLMPGPARKPPENLRRRNAPEQWIVLPAEGCTIAAPSWPLGKPSPAETALWKRLWRLPVACWWAEQKIDPFVVARYVRVGLEQPQHAALGRLESELALTPASMAKLRLVVERPEVPVPKVKRFDHLKEAL
jgi:hypothetical protein